MESDVYEENEYIHEYSRDNCFVMKLIARVMASPKNDVTTNLGETLDIFLDHLMETQQYLTHGICNVRFIQAALFLQASAQVYGKNVDALWENILQYQTKLSAMWKEDLAEELVKHIKKNKRKTLNNKYEYISRINEFANNLKKKVSIIRDREIDTDTSPSEILIEPIDFTEYEHDTNDESTNCSQSIDIEYNKTCLRLGDCINEIQMSNPGKVYISGSEDVLCQYNDLLTNHVCIVPHHLKEKYNNVDRLDINENLQLHEHLQCTENTLQCDRHTQDESFQLAENQLGDTHSNEDNLLSSSPACVNTNIEQWQHMLNDSDDHGYESTQSPLESSDMSVSTRRSVDDSGFFCSQGTSNTTIMEGDEMEHNDSHIMEDMAIPEVDEHTDLSDVIHRDTAIATDLRDVSSSVVEEITNKPIEHLTMNFKPITQSTPKRIVYVKVERLTRKRLLEFDLSWREQPKAKRNRFTFKRPLTITESKFEKFHSKNYIPAIGEGIVVPMIDDLLLNNDKNIENDASNLEMEPADDISEIDPVGEIDESEDDTPDNVNVQTTNALSENCIKDNDMYYVDVVEDHPPDTVNNDNDPENCIVEEHCVFSGIQQLHDNMNSWKDFIQSTVETAEGQGKFNIHEYGTEIMGAFPENKNIYFKDIVAGKNPSDVARYFMASLQLANTCNVELINTCSGKLANDKLKMKLLTRERYHEHLDAYTAPSEITVKQKLARFKVLRRNLPVSRNTSSTVQIQSSDLQHLPSTSTTQPSSHSQPSTSGYQASSFKNKSSTYRNRSSAFINQPSTSTGRFSTSRYQPSTSKKQSSTSREQPLTSEYEVATLKDQLYTCRVPVLNSAEHPSTSTQPLPSGYQHSVFNNPTLISKNHLSLSQDQPSMLKIQSQHSIKQPVVILNNIPLSHLQRLLLRQNRLLEEAPSNKRPRLE